MAHRLPAGWRKTFPEVAMVEVREEMGCHPLPGARSRAMHGVRCLLPGDGAALVRRLCATARATSADIDGI